MQRARAIFQTLPQKNPNTPVAVLQEPERKIYGKSEQISLGRARGQY